jgi:hypothetical protein
MLIPHPDKEKTFQAFTAYNSYACISVRSMILMHKGHEEEKEFYFKATY